MIDRDEEIGTEEEILEEIQELEERLEEAPPEEPEYEEPEEQEEEGEEEPEVVQRAKKHGHVSKEEWVAQGKNPNQWKSPEEFDKTGKILEQLYSLRHKVDQRDREIAALVDYQQRTSKREYDRAKQEIEQRLQNSRDDMDVAGVEHYSKELAGMQLQEQQSEAQQWQQQRQNTLNVFQERNKHWYNEQNPDLVQRAAFIDNELRSIYPNISYDELAQKIETRIQYEFPERLGVANKQPRPSINVSRSSVNKLSVSKPSGSRAFQGLSQDLKDTYEATKRIVQGIGQEYTHADFIAQLKKDGEL